MFRRLFSHRLPGAFRPPHPTPLPSVPPCATFRTDASTSALPPSESSSAPTQTTLSPSPPTPKVKPKGKSRTPPKNHSRPPLPPLDEADLDESFVRGSGPGGQVINKSSISVSLIHRPTGIRVQCHETRSRELNRLKARRRMQELVDLRLNAGTSMLEKRWERERGKKMAKARKQQRKGGAPSSEGEEGGEKGVGEIEGVEKVG